jgi:hypothetical protein
MTRGKLWAVAVGIVGTLSGLAGDAGAGGGSPTGGTPCLVEKIGGSTPVRGTVAVDVRITDPSPLVNQDVSFVLRLERSGVTKFFRLNLSANINGMTNEQVACVMLGTGLSQEILEAFGLSPARTQIVISDKSISNAEDITTVLPVFPGDSSHLGTMADITLYAMP